MLKSDSHIRFLFQTTRRLGAYTHFFSFSIPSFFFCSRVCSFFVVGSTYFFSPPIFYSLFALVSTLVLWFVVSDRILVCVFREILKFIMFSLVTLKCITCFLGVLEFLVCFWETLEFLVCFLRNFKIFSVFSRHPKIHNMFLESFKAFVSASCGSLKTLYLYCVHH